MFVELHCSNDEQIYINVHRIESISVDFSGSTKITMTSGMMWYVRESPEIAEKLILKKRADELG